jgi:hypothetical protein
MRGFKAFMILPVVTLVTPAAASAQIKADTKEEPAIHEGTKLGMANRFTVQIEGLEIAQFAELVALNARATPPTIILKRGKNTSMELWAWHEAARTGELAGARKSATLVIYNYDGKPVARYNLVNAWPSKIETGQESGAGKVAVETLELAHEGFLETVTIVAEKIERVSP